MSSEENCEYEGFYKEAQLSDKNERIFASLKTDPNEFRKIVHKFRNFLAH